MAPEILPLYFRFLHRSGRYPIIFEYGSYLRLTYHNQFESPAIAVKIKTQPIKTPIPVSQQNYYEGQANDLRDLIFQWENIHVEPYSAKERQNLYQTLNMNAIDFPPSKQSVRLTGGEELDWHIKTFVHDVPLAYAWTKIDNSFIQVWSAGVTSTEIGKLLSNLVRLEPNSSDIKYHQEGFGYFDCQFGNIVLLGRFYGHGFAPFLSQYTCLFLFF